ncbi:MAG: tRNA-(ms[2]io[6]A)-hydroxylase [Deltaproteobacteria bacterium]|mgnify:CR=1 FL=1
MVTLTPSLELRIKTSSDWVETALKDFDAFLVDHASCERKASAVGMSFVVRYPDRPEIIEPMISFAREELEHFHQVYKLISQRNLILPPDEEDVYVNRLMKQVRFGREERFLDRLLVSSVIEARGCERLHLVADALPEGDLKQFYRRLARAEGSHKDLFVRLAEFYFPHSVIKERLDQWMDIEADAIASVPHRSALH